MDESVSGPQSTAWESPLGGSVEVHEMGIYIDGEYLPDKEGTTNA